VFIIGVVLPPRGSLRVPLALRRVWECECESRGVGGKCVVSEWCERV
jgi:hypothetical protein